MNKYEQELNNAFREFIRTLENVQENCDKDFIRSVVYDLHGELNRMGL